MVASTECTNESGSWETRRLNRYEAKLLNPNPPPYVPKEKALVDCTIELVNVHPPSVAEELELVGTMNCDQLRRELEGRSLDSTWLKGTLVGRLKDAIAPRVEVVTVTKW